MDIAKDIPINDAVETHEEIFGASSPETKLVIMEHELMQPLSAIICYGFSGESMYKEAQNVSPELGEYFRKIVAQAQRAVTIIKRCTNQPNVVPSHANLHEIIQETLSFLDYEISEADAQIETNIRQSLYIDVDRVQIIQLLINLIRNSLDALKKTSSNIRTISIGATLISNREVQISVADTGCGISDNIVDQIFLPFVTTKSDGRGLGLAISRAIVEAHKGYLRIDNKISTGARFYFNLPGQEE